MVQAVGMSDGRKVKGVASTAGMQAIVNVRFEQYLGSNKSSRLPHTGEVLFLS